MNAQIFRDEMRKKYGDRSNVVITFQAVGGTAYQKVAYHILKAIRDGNNHITVVTNNDNPYLERVREIVGDMNLNIFQRIELVVENNE